MAGPAVVVTDRADDQGLLAQYPAGAAWAPMVARWWGRCLIETAGLSDRLERGFVYLCLLATESGGNPNAVGDGGHSVGLFQLHDQGAGHGLTVEQRQNPAIQFQHFVHPGVDPAFDRHWAAGLKGAELAVAVGRDAERPADPSGYGRTFTRLRAQAGW